MPPTLFVDDRGGSKGRDDIEEHIAEPLRMRGITVEIVRLPYGDFAFEGRGRDDEPVFIGIELKRIRDLVTSIRTERLAGHQLRGMADQFDYSWLVVEGQYKTNTTGVMQVYEGRRTGWRNVPGNMSTSEMHKKVLTYEMVGGVHVRFTDDRASTLCFVRDLYRWWTDKSLEAHQSLQVVHRPLQFAHLSDFREVVSRFPGIGIKMSRAVEEQFGGNLTAACTASVDEWASLATVDRRGKTRRLGLRAAEKIVAFCKGE